MAARARAYLGRARTSRTRWNCRETRDISAEPFLLMGGSARRRATHFTERELTMKTQILGSCLAIAFGLFACAAPTEEDISQSAAANAPAAKAEAEAPAAEHTGESKEELRIRLGAGCAVTCSGGNQTCCCSVGEKCESGATYCQCKDAHDTRFTGTIFGKVAIP